VVLGDDVLHRRRQAHRLGDGGAVRDVLLEQAALGVVELLVLPAQALGQGDLADVVQQGAAAQVAQLLGAEPHGLAEQEGDHRDVDRVQRGLLARVLREQADRQLLVLEQLVHHGADGALDLAARHLGLGAHVVEDLAVGAAGAGEIALAGGEAFELQGEAVAPLPVLIDAGGFLRDRCFFDLPLRRAIFRRRRLPGGGDRGGSGHRRASSLGIPFGRADSCAHGQGAGLGLGFRIALLRRPADAGDAQADDRVDLALAGNLEAVEREGMLHPPQVEVHIHADAQAVYVDELGFAVFLGHFCVRRRDFSVCGAYGQG
jgi:hypothetical protein